MDPLLRARLEPLTRRQRRLRRLHGQAAGWGAGILVALGLGVVRGWVPWQTPVVLPTLSLLAVLVVMRWTRRRGPKEPDGRGLAGALERRHPELRGLLLTAVQQTGPPGQAPGYLRDRLVQEAVDHSLSHDWRDAVPRSNLVWSGVVQALLMVALAGVLWRLHPMPTRPLVPKPFVAGTTVMPGDTELERGSSLVVMARFGGAVPAKVDLLIGPTEAALRRVPLVKSLADPMFGGSVADITNDVVYRVEYGSRHSRDYRVRVFEYPQLRRADATITYPEYTAQPPRRIEDTRRVSAVEGSRLEVTFQLNKPVATGRLVSRGQEPQTLPLTLTGQRAGATLTLDPLVVSRSYQLELIDDEGRTNKVPAPFVVEVLTNRTPELKLASPRGDLRPSALEEVVFEGTVWDDFGVPAYGLAYMVAGQDPTFVSLGTNVAAREKGTFRHVVRLEAMGVLPDDLVSWYVWADDVGPDGQVRRTPGDLLFAEVRPFDEIFRESQAPASQGSEGEQQSGEDSPSTRLVELQKQILNATWKLQRDHGRSGVAPQPGGAASAPGAGYTADATVVRDSQEQARDQAGEAAGEARDPRTGALWGEVVREMERAVDRLEAATKSTTPLAEAVSAERAALQALLRLQQREFEITRSRNQRGSPGGTGRQQQMQRQLDQMDLAQEEDRYETARTAQPPQTAERREQLQVLNRLQELARRQQDLNDRLRELQSALQEARTEAEREEVRRRLQRLQGDEQEMLAQVDELQQRMERAENQSRLASQREQLEQTRQDIQRAAEAAGEGSASQALASGTRAQRQMQEMRDQLRRESASEFAEELRQMRAEARELSRRQQEIQQAVDRLGDRGGRTLSDAPQRAEAIERLSAQKERLTNLVDRATQVSQQTEAAEPLVSRGLYDALRQFNQDEAGVVKRAQAELLDRGLLTRQLLERLTETQERDGAKSLELTAEMIRQGYLQQADQSEERARSGIDALTRGVERAAERVLGDDTEALRFAREELNQLTEQLERELAANQAGEGQATAESPQVGPRNPGGAEPGEAPTPGQDGQAGEAQTASARPPGGETPGSRGASGGGQPSPGEASAETPSGPAGGDGEADTGAREARSGGQRGGGGLGGREPPGGVDRAGSGPGGLDQWLGDDRRGGGGPIIGEGFTPWSDRLREVEEVLDQPTLRNDVATARERARQIRQGLRRDLKKPDWAVVRLQVVRPLVEVRDAISEELARRSPKENLVPIDRDPVPTRYSELVRRYYEDLGKAP